MYYQNDIYREYHEDENEKEEGQVKKQSALSLAGVFVGSKVGVSNSILK